MPNLLIMTAKKCSIKMYQCYQMHLKNAKFDLMAFGSLTHYYYYYYYTRFIMHIRSFTTPIGKDDSQVLFKVLKDNYHHASLLQPLVCLLSNVFF